MKTRTHVPVTPEPKHIFPFITWTFGISWGAWLTLFALSMMHVTSGDQPLGIVLILIGGFGPAIATFITLKIFKPKQLLDFVFSHAKGWWLYTVGFCLVRILTLFIVHPVLPSLHATLIFPIGWLFITFAGGGNEEIGWRGLLQPALEKKVPFAVASVMTAFVWIGWHVPLWLVPGTSQSGVNFLLYIFLGIINSFCLAALYKQTASVFACMLFHGCINFAQATILGALPSGRTNMPMFQVANVVMAAVLLSWWYWKGNRKGAQKNGS